MNKTAKCHCGGVTFIIRDDCIECSRCGKIYEFNFICDGVCKTKADDIVILINEGY